MSQITWEPKENHGSFAYTLTPNCIHFEFKEFKASVPVPHLLLFQRVVVYSTGALHYHSFKALEPIFIHWKLAKAEIKVFVPRKNIFFDQRRHLEKSIIQSSATIQLLFFPHMWQIIFLTYLHDDILPVWFYRLKNPSQNNLGFYLIS